MSSGGGYENKWWRMGSDQLPPYGCSYHLGCVGRQIIIPISVSASIAGYVIINGWNAIYSQFLNGTGKIKMQLFFALAGSLVNIPLAVFLGKNLGIYGVILSTTLISLIIAVFSPIQYSKIINNRALGIWAK